MNERYFNFPVQLLRGFLINPIRALNSISNYAFYETYSKIETGSKKERMKESAHYYGIGFGNFEEALQNGKELYDSIPPNSPKVGLRLSIYWDFYKNDKAEFEKVCLLGFLALKSILGQKPYCKTTNKFWLSRMDGNPKTIKDFSELSPDIVKFSKDYQTDKIKKALRNEWGLITYSRYCRGFYVSFKITLKQLIFEAEKRRISTKEKQYKEHEQQTLKEVRELLNRTRPSHDL